MGNYLFAFYGSIWPETPEEQEKVKGAWMGWFGELGDAIVEQGAPLIPGKIVSKSGNEDVGANPIRGYTVVKADNLDAAIRMAEGCPGIPDGGQLAVYELTAM
jgi:hypothetical protein